MFYVGEISGVTKNEALNHRDKYAINFLSTFFLSAWAMVNSNSLRRQMLSNAEQGGIKRPDERVEELGVAHGSGLIFIIARRAAKTFIALCINGLKALLEQRFSISGCHCG